MSEDKHLYLSLIPQALIASMLKPKDFGSYYSVGSWVHVQGEAIFFEVDPTFRSDEFPFHLIEDRCVRQPNGAPKRSVYLAIYRVLSRIPVSALGNLYLVTKDGRTLELRREDYIPATEETLHLYQEFCPINPMVASLLEPHDFCNFITNPAHPINVPRIVFSQLQLRDLAIDPEHGAVNDLPYANMEHIRDVLIELKYNRSKPSKLVLKQVKEGVIYRMLQDGFYVGDQTDFAFYRFPTLHELENDYRDWWRSAQVTTQNL